MNAINTFLRHPLRGEGERGREQLHNDEKVKFRCREKICED